LPSIAKPVARHPSLERNELGLTIRDYEGSMSTLCAGCGHDSITAAIVRTLWEISMPPQRLVKMSGIGCSSKTPAYFVYGAHGFNSAHGRMPVIEAPTGISVLPAEFASAPRRWVQRYYNLKQKRHHPSGGHYGAWEEPEAIIKDVRDFFRALS